MRSFVLLGLVSALLFVACAPEETAPPDPSAPTEPTPAATEPEPLAEATDEVSGTPCANLWGNCAYLYSMTNNCDSNGKTTSITFACYGAPASVKTPPKNCAYCVNPYDNQPHCGQPLFPSQGYSYGWYCYSAP